MATTRRGPWRSGWAGVVVVGLVLAAVDVPSETAAPPTAASASTRQTMGEIVEALRTLLPFSLQAARFDDPANRQAITQALATLAGGGRALAAHAEPRDAGFDQLSLRLAADTRSIGWRFASGQSAEARFAIRNLANDCVACHARLPDGPASALGKRLFDAVDPAALTAAERISFEIAARQFDRALRSCEALFRAPDTRPVSLDLQGLLSDYLIVALRVRQDFGRAGRGLALLAARSDVPPYLQAHLASWMRTIDVLERRTPQADALEEARSLLAEARRRRRYPADRAVLVWDVAASAVLHRFVSEHLAPSLATAEAYYLLGLAEHRLQRAAAAMTELYLTTAIRMAPQAPFAEDAYTALEEQLLTDYEGSGGSHLPPEVRGQLDDLRRRIDER